MFTVASAVVANAQFESLCPHRQGDSPILYYLKTMRGRHCQVSGLVTALDLFGQKYVEIRFVLCLMS